MSASSSSSPSISRNLFRLLSTAAILMPVGKQRLYSTTTGHFFTYSIAASSIGKNTSPRPPKLNQDFWNYASAQSSQTRPFLRSTKRDSGEDAFFATNIGGSSHQVAFGVADGVGGWQDQGVDPSKYSHGLCSVMVNVAHTHKARETLRPKDILQQAYEAVTKDTSIAAGGCTASLAVADGNGNIETANLGDSGYVVLSPGKISAHSEPQTHAFNTPYQLAKIPQRMQAQHAIFGGSQHYSETPAQADVRQHQLKHGDIVVFGTDGVWDNLSAQDTLGIVTKVMEDKQMWTKSGNSAGAETKLNTSGISMLAKEIDYNTDDTYLPGVIASTIMRQAKLTGLDRKRNGPFAREVKKHYPNEVWQGGKPDDIAVVVAIAVEQQVGKPLRAKL